MVFVVCDGASDEVGDEAKMNKILAFCQEPRSKAEIQKHLREL